MLYVGFLTVLVTQNKSWLQFEVSWLCLSLLGRVIKSMAVAAAEFN